ncbi:MAG: site-specific integrase [Thermodesulfovibrio sp.]|nr:site-specific integrase [Thermodesulfovibrio sp.]
MKKEAYAESTIRATGKRLRHLAKNCSLENPEFVKGFIAQKTCSMAFKESLVEAYNLYCRANGFQWSKPFYQRYDKQPKIPTEEKINMIIANCSKKLALALSIIRDLGLRPIELTWLKMKDIDLESGVVTVTSAKHCVGRTLKIKTSTLAMLKNYVALKKLGPNDRLFPVNSNSLSEQFRRVRNRLSEKLGEPSIKTIRLYDFRHFKASMEYYKTKDLLHVKALLGHRDLRTTLKYVHLIGFPTEEFHVSVARTLQEACQLVEQGFDYVTEMENVKIFRKRK